MLYACASLYVCICATHSLLSSLEQTSFSGGVVPRSTFANGCTDLQVEGVCRYGKAATKGMASVQH